MGLITADQYLDLYGEPRRPWPPAKDAGHVCMICQTMFTCAKHFREHKRRFHMQLVKKPTVNGGVSHEG